jgi:hypothetical protein
MVVTGLASLAFVNIPMYRYAINRSNLPFKMLNYNVN